MVKRLSASVGWPNRGSLQAVSRAGLSTRNKMQATDVILKHLVARFEKEKKQVQLILITYR